MNPITSGYIFNLPILFNMTANITDSAAMSKKQQLLYNSIHNFMDCGCKTRLDLIQVQSQSGTN